MNYKLFKTNLFTFLHQTLLCLPDCGAVKRQKRIEKEKEKEKNKEKNTSADTKSPDVQVTMQTKYCCPLHMHQVLITQLIAIDNL